MGMVFEEEDQVKMKYLTASITASRSSRKSTDTTCQRFFYEFDGAVQTSMLRLLNLLVVMVSVA